MSADANDSKQREIAANDAQPVFTGLQGVAELLASPGLEVLRKRGHVEELRAMLELMRVVGLPDAAAKKDAA